MEAIVNLVQVLGTLLQEINKVLYLPLKIDTYIPWGVIILMYFLYIKVKDYLSDKVLTSSELLKLLLIYLLFFGAITSSYTNFDLFLDKLLDEDDPTYRKFIMLSGFILCFVLVASIGWLGSEVSNVMTKMKYILMALYFPIIVVVLSNGQVLEEGIHTVKPFMPVLKVPFQNPEIMEKPLCTQYIYPSKLEEILTSHPSVKEAVVLVSTDSYDNVIKPHAFVSINTSATPNKYLEEDIRKYVAEQVGKRKLGSQYIPGWVEIYEIPKTPGGNVKRYKLEQILDNRNK